MFFKTVLKRTEKNEKYLNSLRKVYAVVYRASYGVDSFPFSGKYKDKAKCRPLIWMYDCHNGTTDAYYLRELKHTTTGVLYTWTFSKEEAERIASDKNFDLCISTIRKEMQNK